MNDLNEQARITHELIRSDNGTDPFSSAVRATRMPMLITDPRQADNPIVFANDAFSRLTGFERHEIVGRNCRFLQGPATDPAAVASIRTAIANRQPIELELLNYRKDGSTFWNRLLVSPVFDDEGALTYFFASQFDVTLEREHMTAIERDRTDLEAEVARRKAELRASEQRLSFALKAARMGSWSLNLDDMTMIASDYCKENFGRPACEPFTYEQLLEAVHPADRDRRDQAVAEAIADGTPLDIEYRLFTPGGEERWVQVRGQAHYRADGTPLNMAGVSQDVTERRRADEHRDLLANELNHRVKNSFAMVQAVIAQTLRNVGTIEEAREALHARILAMAAANDLLMDGKWEGVALRELLERTLAPFGIADGVSFETKGPDVRLPPRVAVSLGLGLHELATNAAKYGALSIPGGSITIAWELLDRHRLHFVWQESGGPPVAQPSRLGFGSKLINRVLSQEIGTETKIEYHVAGLVFDLVVTLSDPECDARH